MSDSSACGEGDHSEQQPDKEVASPKHKGYRAKVGFPTERGGAAVKQQHRKARGQHHGYHHCQPHSNK